MMAVRANVAPRLASAGSFKRFPLAKTAKSTDRDPSAIGRTTGRKKFAAIAVMPSTLLTWA